MCPNKEQQVTTSKTTKKVVKKKTAKSVKPAAKKSAAPKTGASKTGAPKAPKKSASAAADNLRLMERRKHPRFLLSREQFREVRSGRIFPVYDLSASGLSIQIDEKYWQPGSIITGILNLHPDSIELSPRLIGYYGERAALKLEAVSTYARSVLQRALSPRRLGASLALVREKLPMADYWFHGVCNTDLLLRLGPQGDIAKAEVFFSNYYWSWNESQAKIATGVCQSVGKEKREADLLAVEPVKIESVDLSMDARADEEKTRWAKGIIEAAPLEPRLKDLLLKKFPAPTAP